MTPGEVGHTSYVVRPGAFMGEALGLAFFDINLQSKLNTLKTYIADWKVVLVIENGLRDVALDELRGGRRIGAIREVRSYTGWNLRKAKAYADGFCEQFPELK